MLAKDSLGRLHPFRWIQSAVAVIVLIPTARKTAVFFEVYMYTYCELYILSVIAIFLGFVSSHQSER